MTISGSDGTSDYDDLTDKPLINNVSLAGNKTSNDLGLENASGVIENGDIILVGLKKGVYHLYNSIGNPIGYLRIKFNTDNTDWYTIDHSFDSTLYILQDINVNTTGALFKTIKWSNNSIIINVYKRDTNRASGIYSTANIIKYTMVSADTQQTITGKKMFSILPESSVTPTTDDQLTNKKYVDDSIAGVDSGGLTLLSYGISTWNDFITAYNDNKIVYCRASSNANPATGSQTRLAFMAYVNNATNPTEVEFQYYRSVSSHSATQQGDQVFVYKLTSGGTWSVITREASTKIVAGTNMTSNYSNGVLTLSSTSSGSDFNVNIIQGDSITLDGLKKGIYYCMNVNGVIKIRYTENDSYTTYSSLSALYVCKDADENLQSGEYFASMAFLGGSSQQRQICRIYFFKNNNGYSGSIEIASMYLTTAQNQTITGVKTFNSLPVSSVVPSTDTQLVNKKYVDDSIASAITDALGGNY